MSAFATFVHLPRSIQPSHTIPVRCVDHIRYNCIVADESAATAATVQCVRRQSSNVSAPVCWPGIAGDREYATRGKRACDVPAAVDSTRVPIITDIQHNRDRNKMNCVHLAVFAARTCHSLHNWLHYYPQTCNANVTKSIYNEINDFIISVTHHSAIFLFPAFLNFRYRNKWRHLWPDDPDLWPLNGYSGHMWDTDNRPVNLQCFQVASYGTFSVPTLGPETVSGRRRGPSLVWNQGGGRRETKNLALMSADWSRRLTISHNCCRRYGGANGTLANWWQVLSLARHRGPPACDDEFRCAGRTVVHRVWLRLASMWAAWSRRRTTSHHSDVMLLDDETRPLTCWTKPNAMNDSSSSAAKLVVTRRRTSMSSQWKNAPVAQPSKCSVGRRSVYSSDVMFVVRRAEL